MELLGEHQSGRGITKKEYGGGGNENKPLGGEWMRPVMHSHDVYPLTRPKLLFWAVF